MYYAVLFRKGYYILRYISPDELQKTKDKFYIAEYSFASWLNCFQIWRAFHEKNYKEIFDPLAHTFYDNHNSENGIYIMNLFDFLLSKNEAGL